MKLIKPNTNMLFLKLITLKDLKRWSKQTEIKAFLIVIETASLNSLKSVYLYVFLYSLYELMLQQNNFLFIKSILQCLKSHILMT